uniref:GRAS family protein n=1 Tax=Physcomitrium patens TaxID=3218 RepID=A0A7I4FJP5_PHYPA
MAGSKHERSGDSPVGTGEVSPLAAQLQQAWLQTQMPKAQKRSFTSVANAQNQLPRLSPPGPGSEMSASSKPPSSSVLKSLSTLFPELANVQEKKEAKISSVFEEGEQPIPIHPELRQKKAECLEVMFGQDVVEQTQAQGLRDYDRHASTERSLSDSLIQQSDDSLDFSDLGPLSVSNSFSRPSAQPGRGTFEDDLSYICSAYGSRPSASEYETSAEVEQEKTPLFEYLTDILMDENVEEKKCMFIEMSAYQAMAKELGDLISYDPPPMPIPETRRSDPHFEEDVRFVDSWIDEILSGPLPADRTDSPGAEAKLDIKHGSSPEELYSHTDADRGSSVWNDTASDTASYLHPDSTLSPVDFGNSHALENGSGGSLQVGTRHLSSISSSNGNGVHAPPVDLTDLLIRCAQAVEQADYRHANELIHELRHHSSAYGNGSQRMAHYFMEALVAKISGTGGQLYSALSNYRPSEAQMLKAQMLFCEHCPFIQVPHIYANHAIMVAFKGAPRVHIIDYGILYGIQWPCLIHQLSQRPEGPPHLRITGFRPSARIQDTGRRLAKLAKQMGVPFEFHAIAEKWEAITPAHLLLRDDEVLAVNSMFRFRHLLDESVTAASPRNLVLSRIRSLNPKIFVQGVLNAGYNAPFFMSRFREALAYFSTIFDSMECSFPAEHPDRQIIDHEIVGREILNVVACEGPERVERSETYRQWQARTMRAGFQQKPNSPDVMAKIRMAMRSYHRDYGIGEDGAWFLLGWKERITHAMTVWEPLPDSP